MTRISVGCPSDCAAERPDSAAAGGQAEYRPGGRDARLTCRKKARLGAPDKELSCQLPRSCVSPPCADGCERRVGVACAGGLEGRS